MYLLDTVSSNLTLPDFFLMYKKDNKIIVCFNKKFFSTNNFYIKEKETRVSLRELRKKKSIKSLYNLKDNRIKFINKKKIQLTKGLYVLYIRGSIRGLHVNVSDLSGRVLKVFSLGLFGYSKAKRYNIISLRSLSQEVLAFLQKLNPVLQGLTIYLKGFNSKKSSIISFLLKSSLRFKIFSIVDLSDLPYNGCRPKKLRRK